MLPIADQHKLMFIVRKAQVPTILTAGTMPLNLNTFVSVRIRKTNVYSEYLVGQDGKYSFRL